MTQVIEIYTSTSSATTAVRVDPIQTVVHRFPWTATSTQDADQAWFWSPSWQAGEREVDADIAADNLSPVFDSIEDLFAGLDDESA